MGGSPPSNRPDRGPTRGDPRHPHPPRSRGSPCSPPAPPPASCQWFSWPAAALDRRSAPRLALLLFGAVLARGRRTVTTWIRVAGLSDQFRSCYTAVAAAGKN